MRVTLTLNPDQVSRWLPAHYTERELRHMFRKVKVRVRARVRARARVRVRVRVRVREARWEAGPPRYSEA